MKNLSERPVPEATVQGWLADFENDPPLYAQFPVQLSNGTKVPGIHVVCPGCKACLSGDRVRGRLVRSLSTVVTVTANGKCVQCGRITNVVARFRSQGKQTVIEWLGTDGRWRARDLRPSFLTKVKLFYKKVFARYV